MSYIMVDIEADGPAPGLYSMVALGAIKVDSELNTTFYSTFRPLAETAWLPEALAVSGFTRHQSLSFPQANMGMEAFSNWLQRIGGRLFFVSDNNGFDWQFVNYYFHRFCGKNPFGYSSTNLGSLYKGLVKDTFKNFKHLRKTKHTHNPLDDAMGNAEALLAMKEQGLHIDLA